MKAFPIVLAMAVSACAGAAPQKATQTNCVKPRIADRANGARTVCFKDVVVIVDPQPIGVSQGDR